MATLATAPVVRMKATSTTGAKSHKRAATGHKHSKQSRRQRQRQRKEAVGAAEAWIKAGAKVATETETGFRLSQEFPNCNWLERKIQEEKLKSTRNLHRFVVACHILNLLRVS